MFSFYRSLRKAYFNSPLLLLLRPFFPQLLLLFLVALFVSLCSFFLVPYSFKKVLDHLSASSTSLSNQIWFTAVLYLSSCLFLVIIYRAQNIIWMYLAPKIKAKSHLNCIRHILAEKTLSLNQLSPSKTASSIKEVVNSLPKMVQSLYDGFFSGILSLVVATCTVWSVNYTFGLGLALWIGVYVFGSTFIIRLSKNYAKKTLNVSTGILSKTDELLENIENINLLNREKYEIAQLKSLLREAYSVDKEKEKFKLKIYAFQGFSFVIYQTLSFFLLIVGYKRGHVVVGDIGLILTINFSFVDYFRKVSKELVEFSEHMGTITEALHFLSIQTSEEKKPFAQAISPLSPPSIYALSGKISLNNLHFHYPGGPPLLENVNLDILPGEKVVIMGESGSGKSTLIDLITGLKLPTQGKVFFDGHEMQGSSKKTLRGHMGVVHQKLGLFSGSIMENILYGNLNASDEDLRKVAQCAHVDHFIPSLTRGYETWIDARRTSLSQGQYQRIALARALIRNPQILIFDEVTSNLDVDTMIQVEKNLLEFTKGKTVLFITHHLSEVLRLAADKILIVQQRKILRKNAGSLP